MLPRSPGGQLLTAVNASAKTNSVGGSGGNGLGASPRSGEMYAPPQSYGLGYGHGASQGSGDDQMARSPSAVSILSSSSIPPHPGLLRRRSTDTSGGLDYYWSSLAGAGASSSSSSLASPSSGPLLSVSPSPAPSLKSMEQGLRAARSHGDIGSAARSEIPPPQIVQVEQSEKTPRIADHFESGPSSTRPLRINYPSSALPIPPNLGPSLDGRSPGGWSASSDYSDPTSAPVSAGPSGPRSNPSLPYGSHHAINSDSLHSEPGSVSGDSAYSTLDYRARVDSFEGEIHRALLDPSTQPGTTVDTKSAAEWDVRDSNGSTYVPETPDFDDTILHRTPIAPAYQERPDIRPSYLNFNRVVHRETSPSSSGHDSHSTPTRATVPTVSASDYTPSTAGPAFRAFGMDISASQRLDTPDRLTRDAPRSAPASKSEFGELGLKLEEDEDTIKGKNRRTLPAVSSASSGVSADSLLTPDKYAREGTPTKGSSDSRRSPSPGRSPEPPPRSALRAQYLAQMDTSHSGASSPASMTPNSIKQPLPTIINTSYSPVPSPDKNKPQPPRPDRSPDRQHSPMFSASASISDLTEMLGGAIDAIGLIDSRETPPPTVGEPSRREKPNMTLSLGPLAPAAEVTDRGPITPTSLPMRGASLPGPSTPDPTASSSSSTGLPHTRRQTQPDISRKPSSILSTSSSHQITVQSPTMSISARPWPAAMLYGNVKTLKHAGDRAKGYAKAINELARSESGLKEWCVASAAQVHRPSRGVAAPSKMTAAASLGVRSNSVPSAIPLPYGQSQVHILSPYDPTPHMRNVSAGSEFPMRAGSYTAREISQRIMDPSDQPTALPPNLPYPQLQQHLGAGIRGGLKPSQSMQSVASFASTKKGFFSAIGRKGSAKKESISLGPPGGGLLGGNHGSNGNASGSAYKKDVRGLPISAPRSTSPNKVIEAGGGLQAPRVQASISAPMGPRGPRMGSYTPPPTSSALVDRALTDIPIGRASLDTGLSRMTPTRAGRGSLDYTHSATQLQPPSLPITQIGQIYKNGPVSGNSASGSSTPRDDAVRQMADILPHVERGVLRGYLIRHGDPMQAIGAYLEDEKNGGVIR